LNLIGRKIHAEGMPLIWTQAADAACESDADKMAAEHQGEFGIEGE
jgi:hypothetical protein